MNKFEQVLVCDHIFKDPTDLGQMTWLEKNWHWDCIPLLSISEWLDNFVCLEWFRLSLGPAETTHAYVDIAYAVSSQ